MTFINDVFTLFDYNLRAILRATKRIAQRPRRVNSIDRMKTTVVVPSSEKAQHVSRTAPNPTLSPTLKKRSPGPATQAPRQHVHDDRSVGDGLHGVAVDRFVGRRPAVDDFGPDRRNQLHLFVGIARVLQVGRAGSMAGPRRFLSNLGGTGLVGRRVKSGERNRVVAVLQVDLRRITPKAANCVCGAGHLENPAAAGLCGWPAIKGHRGLVVVQ